MVNQSEQISMKNTSFDSGNWLVKNNDEKSVDYEALPNGEYFVKHISDPDIDKTEEVEKSMPSHSKTFVLSHFRRFLNKFGIEIDGIYSNRIDDENTNSIYSYGSI